MSKTEYGDPEIYKYVYTYEYNAAGKVSKIILDFAGYSTNMEYTWTGDNVTQVKSNDPYFGTGATYTYKYDDKLSPALLGGQFVAVIMYGSPTSKNNATEIKFTSGSTTTTEKRIYTYNSANYAVTQKTEGATLGAKYYYVK